MKTISLINWDFEKVDTLLKTQKDIKIVLLYTQFENHMTPDLVKAKYITELFAPLATKKPIVITIQDCVSYKIHSNTKIKDFQIRYKIYQNNILKYQFDDYIIYNHVPADGIILTRFCEYSNGYKAEEQIAISMWQDDSFQVKKDDPKLGFKVSINNQQRKAVSESICKYCSNYNHPKSPCNDLNKYHIFCDKKPSLKSYNLQECKQYQEVKTPLCYNCKYFNEESVYFSQNVLACTVHPGLPKYDLLECRDYSSKDD